MKAHNFTPRRQSQLDARQRGENMVQAIVLLFSLIFFMALGLVGYALSNQL